MAAPDYRITTVVDGNANSLSACPDIQRGVDRTLTEPDQLGSHFQDVVFGILDGVPDADGQPANGSDGVRVGVSKLLAMNPDGTSSSGTLYLHGRERAQYAVRVLGVTGRVRVLKYDLGRRRWMDQSRGILATRDGRRREERVAGAGLRARVRPGTG